VARATVADVVARGEPVDRPKRKDDEDTDKPDDAAANDEKKGTA